MNPTDSKPFCTHLAISLPYGGLHQTRPPLLRESINFWCIIILTLCIFWQCAHIKIEIKLLIEIIKKNLVVLPTDLFYLKTLHQYSLFLVLCFCYSDFQTSAATAAEVGIRSSVREIFTLDFNDNAIAHSVPNFY